MRPAHADPMLAQWTANRLARKNALGQGEAHAKLFDLQQRCRDGFRFDLGDLDHRRRDRRCDRHQTQPSAARREQQATHLVAWLAGQRWGRDMAGRLRVDTARREAAAAEVLRQRRHRAGDRGQGLVAPTCAGQRLHQRTGIRMLRLGKELRRRRDFDDLSGVHQRHLVGHAGHHRQVVGDQQQTHAVLALQVGQQVEDLRLNRHV